MDILADLTGNRVNYGVNTYGGVKRDISKEQLQKILKAMDTLEERTKYYVKVATEEVTLINRLSGVGRLSKADVEALDAVGPVARASGVDRDVRRDDPYAAYGEVEFKVITVDNEDVYGRTLVRVGELMESYSIVRQVINNLPDGPIAVRVPRKIPEGEVLSRYEAPRGEDVHYVKSNGSDKPERVKLRAPTLANIKPMLKMLENYNLADLPIIIAAIDPCFSCTDRTISIKKLDTGSSETMDWKSLRQYSIDWYRRKGIKF
jgi:NADH-quinone oxidoreductase subunit D